MIVYKEQDDAGYCLSEDVNPSPGLLTCFDTVDGVYDYGKETHYDTLGNVTRYRQFLGTGWTKFPLWASCGYPPTPEKVAWGINIGGGIKEYQYDEKGLLQEEWTWNNDCEWLTEHDDASKHLWARWYYDDFGRPRMRVIPKSIGYPGVEAYSYHYDCWNSQSAKGDAVP